MITDDAVPISPVHHIRIVPAPKMDTPSLVAAVCACGRYRSGSMSEHGARKAGAQHVATKNGPPPDSHPPQ